MVFVERILVGGALVGDGLCFDVKSVGVLCGVFVLRIEGTFLGERTVLSGVSGLHFISIYYR